METTRDSVFSRPRAPVILTGQRRSVLPRVHTRFGYTIFRVTIYGAVLASSLTVCDHLTASVSRLPATFSCAELVPFVHSSLQVRPQLSSVFAGVPSRIDYFPRGTEVSLQIRWPEYHFRSDGPSITSDQMARVSLQIRWPEYRFRSDGPSITSDQMARVSLQIRWPDLKENTTQLGVGLSHFFLYIFFNRSERVTPLLISPFQWLPIKQRIEYKFAMLTGFPL